MPSFRKRAGGPFAAGWTRFVFALFFASIVFLNATAQGIQPQAGSPSLPSRLETARAYRFGMDYYRAVDILLELVNANPAYAPAWQELALCHYQLAEYGQALSYIRSAYAVGPRTSELMNLEAFCHINLGQLEAARTLFGEVVKAQPNNRDARFGLALLDAAAGRPGLARQGLGDALRNNPRDARLLVGLALILRSENRLAEAESTLKEALRWAGNDATVKYAAALMQMENGNPMEAARLANTVLADQPSHAGALLLLGTIYYDQAAYAEALGVLDQSLRSDSKNVQTWFLLGQIYAAFGSQQESAGLRSAAAGYYAEAIRAYTTVLDLRADDEIARLALESLIMQTTSFESPSRALYAAWRFERAAEFEQRFLYEKALVEYRRGLALDPYANVGRRRYANLLRLRNLPSAYFSELLFLNEIGKADRRLDEALEIYNSLLQGSVARDWAYDPLASAARAPYRLQLFSVGPGGIPWHAGSDLVFSRYVRDLFSVSSQLEVARSVPRVGSFADAYRPARESGSDYFLMLFVQETEREIIVQAELRTSRTGALLSRLATLRSGNDRVQQAAAHIVSAISATLPLRGSLLQRRNNLGLVNLGRIDGLKVGDELVLVRSDAITLRHDAPGFDYRDQDIVADLKVTRLDDEVSQVSLARRGFFDRINPGDVVLKVEPAAGGSPASPAAATVRDSAWPLLFEHLRRLY